MPSLIIIVRMCSQRCGTVFLLSLLASDKGKTPPEARQGQHSGKSKQKQFNGNWATLFQRHPSCPCPLSHALAGSSRPSGTAYVPGYCIFRTHCAVMKELNRPLLQYSKKECRNTCQTEFYRTACYLHSSLARGNWLQQCLFNLTATQQTPCVSVHLLRDQTAHYKRNRTQSKVRMALFDVWRQETLSLASKDKQVLTN